MKKSTKPTKEFENVLMAKHFVLAISTFSYLCNCDLTEVVSKRFGPADERIELGASAPGLFSKCLRIYSTNT